MSYKTSAQLKGSSERAKGREYRGGHPRGIPARPATVRGFTRKWYRQGKGRHVMNVNRPDGLSTGVSAGVIKFRGKWSAQWDNSSLGLFETLRVAKEAVENKDKWARR